MAIVPMKRVMFVTLAAEGEALLRLLQRLGVLHPEHIKAEMEMGSLEDERHRLNVQASLLRDLGSRTVPEPETAPSVAPTFADVEQLFAKLADIEERLKARRRGLAELGPWGDFNPDDVRALRSDGVNIRFWSADPARFDEVLFPEGACVTVVRRDKMSVHFVTLCREMEAFVDGAEEFELPDERLTDVEADIERLAFERDAILGRIGAAKAGIDVLSDAHEREEQEYDFRVAVLRAFDDGDIKAFAGWVPAECEGEVREAIGRFKVPVVMEARKAFSEETPPVLTRNISIARMMEPLLRLLGVPNYRGLDPAMFFAPFMMLFFGICLGDVGYGVAMIAGALLIRRVFRKKAGARIVSGITVLFGIATIIVGALTGSVFGAAPGGRGWILLDVSSDHGNPMLLFYISIGLGILHLTIAFILAAIAEYSWQARISKLGSIAVIWGGALLVLGISAWKVVVAVGLLAVLLFSSDSRNPFKRLGIGLWGIYGQTSLVGDVMSYSRLFGLGIATAAIAGVVNTLANDARAAVDSPVFGIILMIVVLIIGHAFNMTMGLISALVHPARLHAVEALPKFVHFSGIEYKPLLRDS
jgi:V/A-type H+-transporting ATPase subunit I